MTDFTPIRKALEKRLEAIVGLPETAGVKNIAWENTAFDPSAMDKWIRPKIEIVAQRPSSVGVDSLIKHEGLFLIDCFARSQDNSAGPKQADDLAQLIQNNFAYGDIITESGYKIRIRFSERIGGIQDSPWYFVPVTVSFYCFI